MLKKIFTAAQNAEKMAQNADFSAWVRMLEGKVSNGTRYLGNFCGCGCSERWVSSLLAEAKERNDETSADFIIEAAIHCSANAQTERRVKDALHRQYMKHHYA